MRDSGKNTTIARPDDSEIMSEKGGLSETAQQAFNRGN